MANPTLEIEAKFLVHDLRVIRDRLLRKNARNTQEAILERNWRFDTADQVLKKTGEILRLRQDRKLLMTFKKRLETLETRMEIEFEVSDPQMAKDFLIALGYDRVMIYEKYREVFQLENSTVMLDQLPFGNFVEVESDTIEDVQADADSLGLIWDRRSSKSYIELFLDFKALQSLNIEDATFEAFMNIPPMRPPDLGLDYGMDATPMGEDIR